MHKTLQRQAIALCWFLIWPTHGECSHRHNQLGELQRIEYNWSETPAYSRTAVTADRLVMPMMKNAFRAEMSPEEIELSDSAAFIWEIC